MKTIAGNHSEKTDAEKAYERLLFELFDISNKNDIAVKYRELYGETGKFISLYITPYFWIFPFIAAILLVHTFKKNKLFGPMQKCLITTMIIDVLFTMLTGFKDIVFNIHKWNFGFVEFRICLFLLLFLRIQCVLSATSLWIKSIMLIHRVLLFIFPFRVKNWNFKKRILVPFAIFHLMIVGLFCAADVTTPITRYRTFQEYAPGFPLKKIDACIINEDHLVFPQTFVQGVHLFSFYVQTIYFETLPICIQIVCTFLLIYLVKKEIRRLSFLAPNCSKKVHMNVKYLVLIKVHIILSISFIIQEIPLYIFFFYGLSDNSKQKDIRSQSFIQMYMFLTFAVGKPIDFLIYASLSRVVKIELQKLFCRRKTGESLAHLTTSTLKT